MYKRIAAPLLKRYARLYPIISIMGPRQSGKTTLAKEIFDHLPYVSLEDPDIRANATQDPRGFLSQYPKGAILDEAQHAPHLFSYLQTIVDASPKAGKFVLTGSHNFSISAQISQSLSGRAGLITLLPLSFEENPLSQKSLYDSIFKGGYPGLYKRRMKPTEFFPSYIQTYLERDVRSLKNIGNLTQFQMFLKLCAGRVGQVLNLSALAQDCGTTHTTAREWISILETSYILFRLPPFHRNFKKRLIKMPKLYFYDTGLVCALLSLEKSAQLDMHHAKGALCENFAILELMKARLNRGLAPNLSYWRDQTGHEIDAIAEWGGAIRTFEIKAAQTFSSDFTKGLDYFSKLAPESKPHILFNTKAASRHRNIKLIPLTDIKITVK